MADKLKRLGLLFMAATMLTMSLAGCKDKDEKTDDEVTPETVAVEYVSGVNSALNEMNVLNTEAGEIDQEGGKTLQEFIDEYKLLCDKLSEQGALLDTEFKSKLTEESAMTPERQLALDAIEEFRAAHAKFEEGAEARRQYLDKLPALFEKSNAADGDRNEYAAELTEVVDFDVASQKAIGEGCSIMDGVDISTLQVDETVTDDADNNEEE